MMERRMLLTTAAAVLAAGVTGAWSLRTARAGGEACAAAAEAERFVVHEWGTFTSMQGSDGLVLEGLSREEEALPPFVYDRAKIRDCPLRGQGWKGLEVPAEGVTRKMETPVIYFHSAKDRRVRVRVDFVKGLMTQWYPVSDLLGPPEGAHDAAPLDVSKVDRSFLAWDVDVLAKGGASPAEVPPVAKDDPWQFAREVDASWVRTAPRQGPDRAGPVEAERYLFYRGLGNFPLPLSVIAERGGRLTLRNAGDVAIPFALAYEVRGGTARIASSAGLIPVKGEASVTLPADDWMPIEGFSKKLETWVWDLLRKHELHDDEARAMVRTWARSWFRSEGVRVLWILPRRDVETLLPLSIEPKPDEVVRVLVGRTEVITPEAEDDVEAALRNVAAEDAETRARAEARLRSLDRFLEPHLRNVLAKTKDETVRANAERRLAGLRASGR